MQEGFDKKKLDLASCFFLPVLNQIYFLLQFFV